ncbi:CRISPR-associated protein Cas3 [uncultured archaeon]|nr:CRISPR-associated protein Cas3 [uncultured archaeon]
MNKERLIAHVHQKGDGLWDSPHPLIEHLVGTGRLAGTFADKFGSGPWAEAMGLLHDLGKSRAEWQNYLRTKSGFEPEAHLEGKNGKIPHAIYGAVYAEQKYPFEGRLISYGIAGHHTGLPDWSTSLSAASSLKYQLEKSLTIDGLDKDLLHSLDLPELPRPGWAFDNKLDLSLWIRMLFSSLVDADFLDTESYMDSLKSEIRGGSASLEALLVKYNNYMEEFEAGAKDRAVNRIRKCVRQRCAEAANMPRGVFSLTVPTGGGKTLSSLAFALNHAEINKMDRVIYVIPFTSIIEQNAGVFRRVLGDDNVIEHHSNISEEDTTPKARLATENWDAPFVITTSVQFFESLFSHKSSKCRKLHNIVNSVVIFDEAQLLPIQLLGPIMATLKLLVEHYGVTILLSTATQPALVEHESTNGLFPGFKGITEIMGGEVSEIFEKIRRVDVSLPDDLHSKKTWEEISYELKLHEQVLCIVSDRKSCRELYRLMPEGTYHLSALMCGEHRSRKIAEIKDRLREGERVRVISTQLIEAGVDVDFPVVYRAMSGLDSIAQAAGRCNREGLMNEAGKVVVFNGPRHPPAGILRKAESTTLEFVSDIKENPLVPEAFNRFFSELYWKVNSFDDRGIMNLLSPDRPEFGISFRTASNMFHIIDDSVQKTVIVRYGESDDLVEELKMNGADRKLIRRLQRYTVNIYNPEFEKLLAKGSVEEVQPGIFALTSSFDYDENLGLMVEEVLYDVERYILQ